MINVQMSLEQNPEKQKIAKDYFEIFYNQITATQAAKMVKEIISDDFVDYSPQFGNSPDKAGFANLVQTITSAFEQEYQVIQLFQEKNIFVAVWKAEAKHIGEFAGIPATGKDILTSGITIYQIDNGKITAHWEHFDALGVMTQLSAE